MSDTPPRRPGRPATTPVPHPESLLTPVGRDPADPKRWLCRCACGAGDPVPVRRDKIIDGSTLSCGCHRRERAGQRLARKRWDSRGQ